MGSEWQEARLTDLYDISSGISKPAKEFGSGYPFLSFKDVFYNFFVPEELSQLVQSSKKEQEKCSIRRGDVFLTRTSETMNDLGMSCVALKDYDKATFNGFTKRLRPKSNSALHPEYVAYYLRSPKFRSAMLAFSTMSTRASLNNEMISRLKISIPPILEQKSIAWILKKLDDKIELNRQMNATLESMAQAMFKSWFVDFDPVIDNALAAGNPIPEPLKARAENRKRLGDQRKTLPQEIQQQFPDCFVFTEELGWIPEGWAVKEAQEIATITIGKTPPRKEQQWFSVEKSTNYVWVSIRDMGDAGVFIGDSSEYLTPESVARFNVKVVPKGSVILSFKLTLGRVAIAQSELTTNEAIAHFTSPKFELSKEFIYSYLSTFEYGSLGSTSSIATAINSKIIKTMPFLVPSQSVLKGFEKATKCWFAKINGIINQSSELTNLRDTLLPKLISGQLRLPDSLIDKFAEQAKSPDAEQITSEAI